MSKNKIKEFTKSQINKKTDIVIEREDGSIIEDSNIETWFRYIDAKIELYFSVFDLSKEDKELMDDKNEIILILLKGDCVNLFLEILNEPEITEKTCDEVNIIELLDAKLNVFLRYSMDNLKENYEQKVNEFITKFPNI